MVFSTKESAMPAPFISILNAFAEARSRDQARYRCPECGSVTRHEPDGQPPETRACWAADRGVICTGRAVREAADA